MKRTKLLSLCLAIVAITSLFFVGCGASKYTVTYSSQSTEMGIVNCIDEDGKTVSNGEEVTEDTVLTFTATANVGYSFDGWYSSNQKVSNNPTYTFAIKDDVNLVAKFTVLSYTLTFISEDSNFGTVSGNGINSGDAIAFGSAVELCASPLIGYDFAGWFVNDTLYSSSASLSFNMGAQDLELIAKFTPQSFTLNYGVSQDVCGSVIGTVESGTLVAYQTSVTLTVTEKVGYDFIGWFINGEIEPISTDVEYTFDMPANAVTLQAKFEKEQHKLIYTVEEIQGEISGTVESNALVAYQTAVTLTVTEKVGYDFIGWFINGEIEPISTDVEYTFDMPANAVTLQAKFEKEQHKLIYSVEEIQGEVSGTVESGTLVVYQTAVTLTVTEKVGYDFIGWFVDGEIEPISTDVEYTFDMPANAVTLQAKFEKEQHKLIYSVEEIQGEISGTVESDTLVAYQTAVTLTVTDKTGFDFIGWYFDGENEPISTEREYSFDMPANAVTLQAKFKAEKRTITYYDGYDRLKISEVDYLTPFDNYQPTKDSHRFNGWFLNATLTLAYNPSTPVTENIILYADWEEIIPVYEVIFVDEDGSQIGGTQLIARGDTIISKPANPNKEGFDFVAWVYYDEEQGQDVVLSSDYQVSGDLTIKATYKVKKVSVKFYKNDADYATNKVYVDSQVDYGSAVARPLTPTHANENYIFAKWVYVEDNKLEFDFDSIITEDVNLIATWAEKPASTYTVKFFDEGENVTPLDVQIVEKGKGAIAPTNPVREGYEFVGWDAQFNEVNADLTVHAVYTIKKFSVVFKDYDGSEIESQTVEYMQSASAPDTPEREGYTFTGWDKEFTEVKKDIEIFAEYSINKFTVNFYNGQTVIETQTDVEYGAFATIPQTPSVSGYSFEGWYKDSTFTEKFDFNVSITENKDVYAKFVEIQIITYTVTFVDGSTVISTQTVVEGGSAIAPGNPSKTGYVFLGWSVEFDSVKSDLEIVAKYEKKKYTVRFFAVDGVTQIGEDYLVEYDTLANSVAPQAPDVENKYFTGWDKDVNSLKITKDTDFKATYASETCQVTFKVDGEEYLTVSIEKGTCVNIPNTPTKIGYVFKYWYLTDNKTNFDFATIITENTVINAYFEKIADIFTVTFIGANGQKYGNVQAVVKDGYAIEPAPYDDGTLTNYIWCTENGNTAFEFEKTAITEDLVLYAKVAG